MNDYYISVLYQHGKPNMVVDALSSLYTASVGHINEERKYLFRDIHKLVLLGVQLVDSTKGGVMVYYGFELSFIIDVKTK